MTNLPVSLCLSLILSATLVSAEEEFERILSFEVTHEAQRPQGWVGGPADTLFVDGEVVHSGEWAARIERDSNSARSFSTLTNSLPMEFKGTVLELRGYLRLEDVSEWAGLWLRQDSESGMLRLDNMQNRQLRGSRDWAEFTIKQPLNTETRTLVFGALLAGEGKIWVDDMQLLVDGKLIAQAPKLERSETALDRDTEFDTGSGIVTTSLTARQTTDLVRLGKVWGFLKYHHPKITTGEVHWDYELFRVLPRVLAATDQRAANAAMLEWAKGHGEIAPCDPCATLPERIHLQPELEWIHNHSALGNELSAYLEEVHRKRHAEGPQFYLSLTPGVGNPKFANEKGYSELVSIDAGYRILALFRYWNMIRYWFPYRDQIDDDWDEVLAEFLPRVVAAENRDNYTLELMALIVRVRDGHANLWGSQNLLPPRGDCQLPVRLRFLEDRAVVVGYLNQGPHSELEVGDVVLALAGDRVDSLIESWLPWYAGSNRVSQLAGISRWMTRGACGETTVTVKRAGADFELKVQRIAIEKLDLGGTWRDLPGETFRFLSDDVAYVKLSTIKGADVAGYIDRAKGTRGLIIDIRNYPSDFVVFTLGRHLVAEATPFARFTVGDPTNPGAFLWGSGPLNLPTAEPHYDGKVVILVDESSMSQAEYTSMAFRSAPDATVVGSTTAGADGNVSRITLPGGLQTMISGIGVFYPDQSPTQRVGIVPDVGVVPSIEGIREGRDEVLEQAVRVVLGDDSSEELVRRIAAAN